MAEQTWTITEKGLEKAHRIRTRFYETLDLFEQIAADEGLTVEEARVLMIFAEHTTIVTNFGEDELDD